MHCTIFRLARGLAIAAAALCLGGCLGKRQFDVAGQVLYNGAPLAKEGGQIIFVGPDGSQVPASIGLDGAYRAVKVTAGRNRVAVVYPNPAFKSAKRYRPKKGVMPPTDQEPIPPAYLTPERYASVDSSELSIEVEKGTVFKVELTDPEIP